MVDVPHFKFPFRLASSGTRVMVVEQDTQDEIMDCVEVLIRTEAGERIEAPEYGILDQTFRERGVDLGYVLSVIEEFEDRASVQLEEEGIVDLLHKVRLHVIGKDDDG